MTSPVRGYPLSPSSWDREYREGKWGRLNEVSEIGRYGLIAAYVRRFGTGGQLLDLGCGEGILHRYVYPFISSYTGIDASLSALSRAEVEAGQGRTLCADLDGYPLEELGHFDVAVANEVLYHLVDPLAMVRRAHRHLGHGGVLVVSMFDPPSSSRWRNIVGDIWEGLDSCGWPRLASSRVSNAEDGLSWNIRAWLSATPESLSRETPEL